MIKFDQRYVGMVGTEQECFLTRGGRIVDEAPLVISQYGGPQISYELSACQLEHQRGPVPLSGLGASLREMECRLQEVERRTGLVRLYADVAPEDMPLTVYPTERYRKIAARLSPERLLAACRIIGTHIHVGMPSMEAALAAYNAAATACQSLCEMGDRSGGERLRIYCQVCPDCLPPTYRNLEHYLSESTAKGFANDPRACWYLVRISRYGTVEFRMFSASNNHAEVIGWARTCHDICLSAI